MTYEAANPDWAPLEVVIPEESLGDWMWMGRIRDGDVVIEQYKHCDTRQYLNLDHTHRAWTVSLSAETNPYPSSPRQPQLAPIAIADAIAAAVG